MKPTLIDPFEVSPHGTPQPGALFPDESAPPPTLFSPKVGSPSTPEGDAPASSGSLASAPLAETPVVPPVEGQSPGEHRAYAEPPTPASASASEGEPSVEDRPTFLDGPPPRDLQDLRDHRNDAPPRSVAIAPPSAGPYLAPRPRGWLRVGLWLSDG